MTGCDVGEAKGGPKTGTGGARPSAAASPRDGTGKAGPALTGPAIPGLAEKPSWSLASKKAGKCAGYAGTVRDGHSDEERCTVGDSAVLVEEAAQEDSADSRFIVRLRDLKTGALRKKLEVKVAEDPAGGPDEQRSAAADVVQVGEWKDGSPALLVRSRVRTPADGLQKSSLKSVFTMYDPRGVQLGSSSFDDTEYAGLPVRRGSLVDEGDVVEGGEHIPIGGGRTVHTRPLAGGGERLDQGSGIDISVDSSYQPSSEWQVATDAVTGKMLWSTEDLEPPAAVREQLSADRGTSALVSAFEDGDKDKALLAWSAYGKTDSVLTLIDARTGHRITQGPAIEYNSVTDDDAFATTPDGKITVTQFGEGAVGWDTESGEELWRQAEDEQSITPRALPGNGVLYADLSEGASVALDMRDKKILRSGIEELPEFSTDGRYAVLRSDGGFFVLATRTV
ncbi:outer membrane protein assembly factor BamB family protein [Streptomyces sclerotialus]|uniref:outer membrane protein assembly factor BamB family protein n=1 Tax=Streptomyces sclerotialus TaxID=1957 RepID=UPI0018C932AF